MSLTIHRLVKPTVMKILKLQIFNEPIQAENNKKCTVGLLFGIVNPSACIGLNISWTFQISGHDII